MIAGTHFATQLAQTIRLCSVWHCVRVGHFLSQLGWLWKYCCWNCVGPTFPRLNFSEISQKLDELWIAMKFGAAICSSQRVHASPAFSLRKLWLAWLLFYLWKQMSKSTASDLFWIRRVQQFGNTTWHLIFIILLQQTKTTKDWLSQLNICMKYFAVFSTQIVDSSFPLGN